MSGVVTRVSATRRFVGGWNRFWFAEVDGLPLGLVRVGFAAASLCFWAGSLPWLGRYYSDGGELPIASARVWGTEWFGRFLMPDALGGLGPVLVLAVLYGVALVALLLGWRTRAAAVATWLLTYWFHHRNPTFLTGGDEVLRLASLYLALSFLFVAPADRALSLDRARLLRSGAAAGDPLGPTRIPAWPVRLIQIQVAIVYLVSGFWKVVDPAWQSGDALWVALASPTFSRFGPPSVAPRPLFAAATLAVAWWEFLFPVLMWRRRTRLPALAVGLALHLFILVAMNVGVFPVAMIALYPAFLPPDSGRALLARVPGLGGPRPQPPRASTRTGSASSALP